MSFILYAAAGFAAGILGGMGMGGGTILIPALTLLFGVGQHAAQAANVIAFLPMSLFALSEHKKRGLLRTDGLSVVIIPAVIAAAAFGLLMAAIPARLLGKLFGAFLVALAVKELFGLKDKIAGRKRRKESGEGR